VVTPPDIECCTAGRGLTALLQQSPATVVQIRVLALASMFPADLRAAAASLPFSVSCAVAPAPVAAAVGVSRPRLGEVLVFAGERLVGRPGTEVTPDELRGLLRAEVGPAAAAATDAEGAGDSDDPFEVLGVSTSATFEEVRAAWRRHLAAYHPDRFERAGEKIRRVALTETQRLNAAFHAVAAARTGPRAP
jgi:hypothetical protein